MKRATTFRLFACCVPVRGACRSTICDLQRKKFHLIPNALQEIVTDHQNKTLEEIKATYGEEYSEVIDEYFQFLVENDLGFWTDEAEAFPDLDLEWEQPDSILNAIIDVDSSSAHDFGDLFSQLGDLGCKHVQIRFFCHQSAEDLEHDLLRFLKRGRIRGVELILRYCDSFTEQGLDELSRRHQRITGIFFHSAPRIRTLQLEKSGTWVCYRPDEIDSHAHCGHIHPAYFSPTMDCFLESQQHNTCLNRKIAVDARGEIKNCPSLQTSFGNVKDTSLHAATIKQGFKDLWEINKDQIDTCKDCEFRYICSDCRAFIQEESNVYSKPSKCTYDPYTAQWT